MAANTVKCSKVIKTCEYSFSPTTGFTFCDYLCKTGNRRGCPAEQCDKYVKKKRNKRPRNF